MRRNIEDDDKQLAFGEATALNQSGSAMIGWNCTAYSEPCNITIYGYQRVTIRQKHTWVEPHSESAQKPLRVHPIALMLLETRTIQTPPIQLIPRCTLGDVVE
jgi:hypothetical protein